MSIFTEFAKLNQQVKNNQRQQQQEALNRYLNLLKIQGAEQQNELNKYKIEAYKNKTENLITQEKPSQIQADSFRKFNSMVLNSLSSPFLTSPQRRILQGYVDLTMKSNSIDDLENYYDTYKIGDILADIKKKEVLNAANKEKMNKQAQLDKENQNLMRTKKEKNINAAYNALVGLADKVKKSDPKFYANIIMAGNEAKINGDIGTLVDLMKQVRNNKAYMQKPAKQVNSGAIPKYLEDLSKEINNIGDNLTPENLKNAIENILYSYTGEKNANLKELNKLKEILRNEYKETAIEAIKEFEDNHGDDLILTKNIKKKNGKSLNREEFSKVVRHEVDDVLNNFLNQYLNKGTSADSNAQNYSTNNTIQNNTIGTYNNKIERY